MGTGPQRGGVVSVLGGFKARLGEALGDQTWCDGCSLSRRLGQASPKGAVTAPALSPQPQGKEQNQLEEPYNNCLPGNWAFTAEQVARRNCVRFPTSNSLFLGDNLLLYFRCSSFFLLCIYCR